MQPNTHLLIDRNLCGTPVSLGPGKSRIDMKALPQMAVDEKGLVHGGFVFGLADYAAMLAVNDPYVVLGGASVKFLKPVKIGDKLTCDAETVESDGKKKIVSVKVVCEGKSVFEGEFYCYVLPVHVLDR